MYSPEEREDFFNKTIDFIRHSQLFEGVVQIGSGTIGYRDQYSDIDLMAAYFNKSDINKVQDAVNCFFHNLGAGYIYQQKWTETVLGVSVYFSNGLGIDASFGLTEELPICSPQWKVVLDKTGMHSKHIEEANNYFLSLSSNYGIDDSIHYKFNNALRRCMVAIKRNNYIYASLMLNEARQCVLDVQVLNEGKKVHQFNAYHTLDNDFINQVSNTFPIVLSDSSLIQSKDYLHRLYFEVVRKNGILKYDDNLNVLLST